MGHRLGLGVAICRSHVRSNVVDSFVQAREAFLPRLDPALAITTWSRDLTLELNALRPEL
jgi:hypothetical protein